MLQVYYLLNGESFFVSFYNNNNNNNNLLYIVYIRLKISLCSAK
jgi:hypothetical protein